MDFYWLTLGTLATWRLTFLLALEDGPFMPIARLRRAIQRSPAAQVLDCSHCLSLWSAAILAWPLARSPLHYLYLSFALSAGSILLESLTRREGSADAGSGAKAAVLGGPLEEPRGRLGPAPVFQSGITSSRTGSNRMRRFST